MASSPQVDVLFAPPIDRMIDQLLVEIGFGFNPAAMKRFCRREALRLNSKTDAELWLIGLTRDQIPAHVLRHKFHSLSA